MVVGMGIWGALCWKENILLCILLWLSISTFLGPPSHPGYCCMLGIWSPLRTGALLLGCWLALQGSKQSFKTPQNNEPSHPGFHSDQWFDMLPLKKKRLQEILSFHTWCCKKNSESWDCWGGHILHKSTRCFWSDKIRLLSEIKQIKLLTKNCLFQVNWKQQRKIQDRTGVEIHSWTLGLPVNSVSYNLTVMPKVDKVIK